MSDPQASEPTLHSHVKGASRPAPGSIPHLELRAEFEEALKNYRMNPAAKETLQKTPLVILNGPFATGRNTIIRQLVETGNYYFIVSDTTRPQRYNDGVLETNGVEYFFRTEAEMLSDVRRGEFLEAELIHNQQVSGQSIRELKKAHDQGKIAVSEIEILGVLETLRIKPDTVAILLLPPSFEEWLRRAQQRTVMSPQEQYNRLQTAVRIFKTALERDVFIFVVNDAVEQTVKTIDEIARLGVHHADTEKRSRDLAKKLLEQTQEYLKTHPAS
jgi:guanylate kinase